MTDACESQRQCFSVIKLLQLQYVYVNVLVIKIQPSFFEICLFSLKKNKKKFNKVRAKKILIRVSI